MTLDAQTEAEAIGKFKESFIGYIDIDTNVPKKVSLGRYTFSPFFTNLNKKYCGRGTFYLGIAINELLDEEKIRFEEDLYYPN